MWQGNTGTQLLHGGNKLSRAGLAMILGGGMSNYTDRRNKGYVTDYVSLNVKNKELRKIVFNLSDVHVLLQVPFCGQQEIYFQTGKNNLRQKTKDTWHSALGVFCFSGEQ